MADSPISGFPTVVSVGPTDEFGLDVAGGAPTSKATADQIAAFVQASSSSIWLNSSNTAVLQSPVTNVNLQEIVGSLGVGIETVGFSNVNTGEFIIIEMTNTFADPPRVVTLLDADRIAGRIYIIHDASPAGSDSIFPIRIVPESGLIEGLSEVQIRALRSSVMVYSDGTTWRIIGHPFVAGISENTIGDNFVVVNERRNVFDAFPYRFLINSEETGSTQTFANVRSATDDAPLLEVKARARGTFDTPTAVVVDDGVYEERIQAYDGTDFLDVHSIEIDVASAPAAGVMPTEMLYRKRKNGGSTLESYIMINENNTIAFIEGVELQSTLNFERKAVAVSDTTNNEIIIAVTDTTAARTITLQSMDNREGRIYIIKDESGAAATNNITIDTQGAQTIDGQNTLLITADYGVARLYSNGSNWFTI